MTLGLAERSEHFFKKVRNWSGELRRGYKLFNIVCCLVTDDDPVKDFDRLHREFDIMNPLIGNMGRTIIQV